MAEDITSETTNDRSEYYNARFERQRALLESLRTSQETALPHYASQDEMLRTAYRQKRGEEPPHGTFNSYDRAQAGLADTVARLEFLRPSSDEDMAYRFRVLDTLAQTLREACPPGLPLRFHGAPLHTSREIIGSGELSSAVDRLGFEQSMDTSGQVSVTTPETLGITVDGYIDGNENDYCVPLGCVFVMLPKSEEDAKAGDSLLMGNVDFRTEPNRLAGILTSPENLPTVQAWASEAQIDPSKVSEFFAFADHLSALGQGIQDGSMELQSLVPYPLPQSQTA